MVFQVIHDGGLEPEDVLEDAAADGVASDLGEEALDHVEPGGRGGREVQMETATPIEDWRCYGHPGWRTAKGSLRQKHSDGAQRCL